MVAPGKFAGQKSAPGRCFFARSGAILADVVTVVHVTAPSQLKPGPGKSPQRASAPGTSGVRRLLLALALTCTALVPVVAKAEQTHTVRSGQNLGVIAKKYGVTVWSLAARNHIPPDGTVREGQVLNLPEKGLVYISDGQTLWSVARRHGCTVEALASANNLKSNSSLRPGMSLRLPGAAPVGKAGPTGKSWGTPKRPGRVELFRVATAKSLTISLVDARGRVRAQAPNQLAAFLKPRNSTKQKAPQKRLITLLAQVSDHFGGRKIHVVSGYRVAGGYTSHESRHVAGAAIDMRVEGVPNRVLCDYLRHFDDVGVGFYPNSTFIHFDVRERNAYWIDVSGPGQKPTYLAREDRDTYTGDKTAGLAELGASVAATLETTTHGEPTAAESDDE
jgi:LysM repeat protein